MGLNKLLKLGERTAVRELFNAFERVSGCWSASSAGRRRAAPATRSGAAQSGGPTGKQHKRCN